MWGLLPTTVFVIVQDSHQNSSRFRRGLQLTTAIMQDSDKIVQDWHHSQWITCPMKRQFLCYKEATLVTLDSLQEMRLSKVIEDLSDEPYGLVPETVDKDRAQSKQGSHMALCRALFGSSWWFMSWFVVICSDSCHALCWFLSWFMVVYVMVCGDLWFVMIHVIICSGLCRGL